MSKIINNVIATLQQLETSETDMMNCILSYEIELSGLSITADQAEYMLKEIASNLNIRKFFLLPY